jgi:hypothetical protein
MEMKARVMRLIRGPLVRLRDRVLRRSMETESRYSFFEVETFLNDNACDVLSQKIDSLLQSFLIYLIR